MTTHTGPRSATPPTQCPPQTSPTVTPRFGELTAAIRAELRPTGSTDPVAARVAAALAPFLPHPDLLTPAQLEPDPHAYRQHLLHVEPDGSFSVVALVWLPGQATRIHDHTAWCVVGTYLGAEQETAFRLADRDGRAVLEPVATTVLPAGTVTHLTPPGDIHLVRNATTGKVVSLHVYGTDVSARGTSIRRVYDLPILPVPAGEDRLVGAAAP
ncbi:cysteine dioxygenase [Kitasatospora sp. LaBMicrA B282]|uniref:cysteine dioxygenase family protein n=1 Tax=Kitasatospora sp. LaBMicrA B282 TaxID=3420949 RepID=UPI003D0C36E3